MAQLRGSIVLSLVRFVKETYGPDAHDRVVRAMTPDHAATFLGSIREASWEPAADMEIYMALAKAMLAPHDAAFDRRAGYFAGCGVRGAGVEALLVDPNRLAPFIWHSLFETGRVEIAEQGPSETIARIHDFPTTRAACLRMVGSWEGLFQARVEETACVLDGSPYCEMRIAWQVSPGQG